MVLVVSLGFAKIGMLRETPATGSTDKIGSLAQLIDSVYLVPIEHRTHGLCHHTQEVWDVMSVSLVLVV